MRNRQIEESAFWKMLADYIEPGREIVEIAPAESFAIEVRLNAVSWVKQAWTGFPDPKASTRYLVSAQFESSNAATRDGQTNWIGKDKTIAPGAWHLFSLWRHRASPSPVFKSEPRNF